MLFSIMQFQTLDHESSNGLRQATQVLITPRKVLTYGKTEKNLSGSNAAVVLLSPLYRLHSR